MQIEQNFQHKCNNECGPITTVRMFQASSATCADVTGGRGGGSPIVNSCPFVICLQIYYNRCVTFHCNPDDGELSLQDAGQEEKFLLSGQCVIFFNLGNKKKKILLNTRDLFKTIGNFLMIHSQEKVCIWLLYSHH